MKDRLIELVNQHYASRDKCINSNKSIVDFLKNNLSDSSLISAMLTDEEFDIGKDKRVNRSWITDYKPTPNNDPQRDLKMFGVISSYKDAADSLIETSLGGTVDYMFQPIMFCYCQYLELLLKDYKSSLTPGWSCSSHNPLAIWNQVKNDIKNNVLTNPSDYSLVDSIICNLFSSTDSSMQFRYLEDIHGVPYIDTNSSRANLYSVRILMDIIDDMLRDTYDGNLTYTL